MTDQYAYKYPSPLTGYEDAPPLSYTESQDKSMPNPKNTALSKTYDKFEYPLNNGDRGGLRVYPFLGGNWLQGTDSFEIVMFMFITFCRIRNRLGLLKSCIPELDCSVSPQSILYPFYISDPASEA